MTPEEMIKVARPIAEALLPTTATAREKVLLTAEVAIILDKKPEIITTIWDPYKCPVGLLPYLAWALSVDVYDDEWSEDRKRNVIAASPLVHRRKGTVDSVERALAGLGLDAVLQEWHLQEPVGRRGTFNVDVVYRNGSDLPNARALQNAYDAVVASKPKSRNFSFRSVIEAEGGISTGATPSLGMIWNALPAEFDPDPVTAILPVTAAIQKHFIYEAKS